MTQVDNGLGAFDYAYVGQTSRVDHIDYPNGMKVEYDYFGSAGDHLLQQIKNLSAGPSPAVISQFDYTYNQDRTIDTWRVEQGGQASTWTYGYDEVQQLTDATRETLSGTVLEEERYVYDKAGNRISVTTGTTTISTRNYKVNNLNQLVSERGFGPTMFSGTVDQPVTVTVDGAPAKVMSTNGGAPFRFEHLVDLSEGTNDIVVEATNGDGTVATKTYRVTTTGTTTLYEYDLNGNLRFERDAAGVVQREYRWDQENRLVALLEGTKESQYTYNGKSQRVRIRKLDGGVEQSNDEYVWCHEDTFCQKRSGSPPIVDRNYFEQGFTEGTDSYTSAKDHLMSVRETVADDGATVESRLDFGPYGDVRASGSGVESDHEFTGHFEDEDLAMTFFRAYDEETGRWLSRDPIGIADGPNIYAYVRGQPTRFRDPNGQYTDTYTECVKKHGPAGCGGPMPPPPPNPAPAPFLLCFFFPSFCDPGPPDPPTPCDEGDDDFCKRERDRCRKLCSEARHDPDMNNIWGGGWKNCMDGCLPERCGGNPTN